jgi:hypothetical protein
MFLGGLSRTFLRCVVCSVTCLSLLTSQPSHYLEIVEERGVGRLCGYPLCDKPSRDGEKCARCVGLAFGGRIFSRKTLGCVCVYSSVFQVVQAAQASIREEAPLLFPGVQSGTALSSLVTTLRAFYQNPSAAGGM